MTLPNKLTVARLVMAPLFFIVFQFRGVAPSVATVICLVLFVVMELTDLLDGQIARKHNLVTDLGKVMDPFGDTLAHLTYFVCFMNEGIMQNWVFMIIMYREFSILFIRMLLVGQGKVMPANIFGKSKTVLYALSSVMGILYLGFGLFAASSAWLATYLTALKVVFVLCAVASLGSFMIYMSKIAKEKSLSKMTR